MLPYGLIRPFLFALDPESAHDLTLASLSAANAVIPSGCGVAKSASPIEVMGLKFPNRVGLAAGLDKNGTCIDGFAHLGFGFLEIGTVTPRPQAGNPKPRLFRLPAREAIINRMGFNNDGVAALVDNVRRARYTGILGINIGKNADTAIDRAADDYLACFDQVYAFASYVTVNISSPNTANLRQLQSESELDALLAAIKVRQAILAERHGRYVPVALKIAPDLDTTQVAHIAGTLKRHRCDAVIATNTTIDREVISGDALASESGGLSGAPLFQRSTAIVATLAQALAGEVPIIAAGGIVDGAKAKAKLDAGASLVQIYSGLIFRGPSLVRECVAATA
jgi:dihydroorotate dehydrogenase